VSGWDQAGDVVWWVHPPKVTGNCRCAGAWERLCGEGEPMAVGGFAARRAAGDRAVPGLAGRAAGGGR